MDGSTLPASPNGPQGSRDAGAEDGDPPSSLLTRFVKRTFGAGASSGPTAQPDPGIRDLARRAAAEEQALLLNVIRMRDQTVEDVMIPRADIVAAPETATLASWWRSSARPR